MNRNRRGCERAMARWAGLVGLGCVTSTLGAGCGLLDSGDGAPTETGGMGGDLSGGGSPSGSGGVPTSGGAASGGGAETGGSATGGYRSVEGADFCFDTEDTTATCEELFNRTYFKPPAILARASEIAAGGKFRMFGGSGALLEVAGAEAPDRYRIVVPSFEENAAPVHVFGVNWPDEDFEVRHLWSGQGLQDGSPFERIFVFALACTDESCALLGAERGDEALVPLSDAEFPTGVRPEKIAVGFERLCLYGDELHCFEEGAWRSRGTLPAGSGARFLGLALGPESEDPSEYFGPDMAVTDTGAVLRRAGPGLDFEVLEPASEDLGLPESFQSYSGFVSVLYESGAWFGYDRFQSEPFSCGSEPNLVYVMPTSSEPEGGLSAIDESGMLYGRAYPTGSRAWTWCRGAEEPIPNAIAYSHDRCGIVWTAFAMTEDELLSYNGKPWCAID